LDLDIGADALPETPSIETSEVTTHDSDTPLTRIRERIIERLRTLHRPDPTTQLQIDRLGQENQNLQKQLAALISALQPLPQRLTALETQTSKQNSSTQRQLSQIANQLAAILPLELEEKRSLMLKLSDLLTLQNLSNFGR
jgi:predicted  nucleic acid-binding Zn-ribbon protein